MDNWTLGSALIGVGLKWWQAIIAILVAEIVGACASALNSRFAEVYHIGYPVVARSVFGIYGSFYAVFARAVLAIIYYSLKRKPYPNRVFIIIILTSMSNEQSMQVLPLW